MATIPPFVVVGENIHCTRVLKRGGAKSIKLADGREAVAFARNGKNLSLPVPANWATISPPYAQDKIKHVALALYQCLNGNAEDKDAGTQYLCHLAERQITAGATFLDVNVDEYSPDPAEAIKMMEFLVTFLAERYQTPLSIDSSNADVLRAGLAKCRKDIRAPMINSISLERVEIVQLAKEFNADAIVSAAGAVGMPADAAERMANFRLIVAKLDEIGIARDKLHLDPLVLPISTDPLNGQHFLQATAQARAEFTGVHLSGGLSNVSFGMPERNLLNMVFTRLCMEAGTDGGIVDCVTMPVKAILALDQNSETYKLARAFLTGEDLFGGEFIAAHREGRLKG